MTPRTQGTPATAGAIDRGTALTSCRETTTKARAFQADVVSAATLEAIRDALPTYAGTLGDLRQTGPNRWLMSCPLPEHADNRPSFAVFLSHRGGYRAKCSCQWSGDAVALARALNPGMTFRQAVAHVAAAVGLEVETEPDTPEARKRRKATRPEHRTPELPPLPELPPDFEARHRAARARLYGSPELLEAVAAELGRNVTPELVQSLTYSSDALGWANGRPLYLYEHGAKARNPKGTEPRFQWLEGRAALPWRWHFAARDEVREIYMTESESDAVALVAANLEALHPKQGKPASAVVAIPGAGNFAEGWAPLFKGKRVTLVFDKDNAGQRGAERVAKLLTRYAVRVAVA